MVQFNCNNGNLFPSYRLPIQSKKGYESLCEVMYEYLGNNACLMNEISQKIRDNTNLYENYSKSDHSDIGSHTHAFPSFNLGDDYIAYIGMNWPEMKEFLIPRLTKEFILEDGGDDMTLGMIYPDNLEGKIPAFFTKIFFEDFSDSTKFGKDLFFLDICKNGYFFESDSGEVRWLFSKGVAFGHKYCMYYVFNEFSDKMKYQGEELTDERIEELMDDVWSL